METSAKADARRFLKQLQRFINARLPAAPTFARDVEEVVKLARASTDCRHLANPEAAVVNNYLTPLINAFLREEVGLAEEAARQALLSESWKNLPTLTSGTPARSAQHPFSKVVGVAPKEVVRQWRGKSKRPALTRSCPDLALREPAAHRIVFEAKYCRREGLERAESELVTGVYQAFFYRGLPAIIEKPPRPSWDYEYACLLMCDGTRDASMVNAWNSLDASVRRACWEGGNIYVMVLRGPDPEA